MSTLSDHISELLFFKKNEIFLVFFGKGNRSIKKRRFLAAAVTVYIPIKTAQISFEKSCFSCQKEKKNLDDALQEPTHNFKKNLFE